MDRKTSGGGTLLRRRMMMGDDTMNDGIANLPLIYEATLQERTLFHNTGENAFRCSNRIAIQITVPKENATINGNGLLLCSVHTDSKKILKPWENMLLDNRGIQLGGVYGINVFIDAFKMESGAWISKKYNATLANMTASDLVILNDIAQNATAEDAITGLIVGNGKNGGDLTMPEGTIIRVWGT